MHTHTQIRGRTAEALNKSRRRGSVCMPKQQDSKTFLSTPPKQDWLPTPVCMTHAPMWRSQAASFSVSHSSSKSGLRSKRSVSSSSPLIASDWNKLEATHCLIGLHSSQWKNRPPSPFLFKSLIHAAQQGVVWRVHACLVHKHATGLCAHVYMLAGPSFCTAWCESTGYLIAHDATLKHWGHPLAQHPQEVSHANIIDEMM